MTSRSVILQRPWTESSVCGKPCCGGSSIGVSIVRTIEEYEAALEEAFRWEEEILIEDYIEGREFSVGVLEGKALPNH